MQCEVSSRQRRLVQLESSAVNFPPLGSYFAGCILHFSIHTLTPTSAYTVLSNQNKWNFIVHLQYLIFCCTICLTISKRGSLRLKIIVYCFCLLNYLLNLISSNPQRHQFDGPKMHRKGDWAGVCRQDYRPGDGEQCRVDHESDVGSHPARNRHAATCNGSSLHQ